MKKIPVFATFGKLFDAVVENIVPAWHMTWPWLVPMGLVRLWAEVFTQATGPIVVGNIIQWDRIQFTAPILLFNFVVATLGTSAMAVMWHRYILLGEQREGPSRMRVDGTVMRYLGVGLLITLFMFGASFALGLVGTIASFLNIGLGLVVGLLIGVPAFIWLIGFVVRLQIKLVATALGQANFTFGNALDLTHGNTWRLAGLFVLLSVVLVILSLVGPAADLALKAIAILHIAYAGEMIHSLVNWFQTLLAITLLTMLYEFFVEEKA